MKKRVIAMFVVIAMLLALMPATGLAVINNDHEIQVFDGNVNWWNEDDDIKIYVKTLNSNEQGGDVIKDGPDELWYHPYAFTFTPQARDGYEFVGWENKSGETWSGGNPVLTLSLAYYSGDCEATAVFQKTATPAQTFTVKNNGASGAGYGGDHGYIKVKYNGSAWFTLDVGDTKEFTYDENGGEIDVDFFADPNWQYRRHVEVHGTPPISEDPTTIDPDDYKKGGSGGFHRVDVHPQWGKVSDLTIEVYTNGVLDPTGGTVTTDPGPTYWYGDSFDFEANPAAAYSFDGWDGDLSGDTNPESLTLGDSNIVKAYFTSIIETYNVTYHGNGSSSGSPPEDNNDYIAGADVTVLGQSDLSKYHYEFNGWNTQPDGNGTAYDENDIFSMGTQDVDLYAQWGYLYDHIDVELDGTLTIVHQIDGVTQSSTILDVTVSHPSASVVGPDTFDLDESDFDLDPVNNEFRALDLSFRWPDSVTVNATLTVTTPGVHFGEVFVIQHTFGPAGILAAWNLCPGTEDPPSYTKGFDFVIDAEDVENIITNTITFKTSNPGGTIGGGYTDIVHTGVLDGTAMSTLVPLLDADPNYSFVEWSPVLPTEVTEDGIYTAIWEENVPITYTVAYDKNNVGATGTTADSLHVYDVPKNLTKNGYSLTGYTFNGWNTKKDGSGDAYADEQSVMNLTSIDGATVTLYAQWTGNSYTVTYDKNNVGATGTTADSSHVYDVPKNLTKNGYSLTGYTFNGWNTKKDGTGDAYSDEQSVKNLTSTPGAIVTLYAQWTGNKYTVKYDKNAAGATGMTADSSHVYDVPKKLTKNGYSLTGYTFNGWNTKKDGTGTPYADEQSVVNLTSVDGATVTLFAQWTGNKYTVTYDKNAAGATGTTANSFHVYDVPKKLTKNGYSLAGNKFNGWNTKKDGTGDAYADEQSVKNLTSVAGDTVTLFAQWTPITYTVTYDAGSHGSIPVAQQSQIINEGGQADDAAPTSLDNGYYFIEWEYTPDTFDPDNVTMNASAVAVYEYRFKVKPNVNIVNGEVKVTYAGSVYFVGPGETKEITAVDGYDIVAFQGEPDTGYEFLKWNYVPNQIYFNNNGYRERNIYDTTVFTPYPHFTATVYNITYTLNGGTVNPANPLTYTIETPTFTLNNPTRTGYTFIGWTGTGLTNFTMTVTIPVGSTGDRAYEAHGIINKHNVYFDENGGSYVPDQYNVPYFSLLKKPIAPTKLGYTFKGWYRQEYPFTGLWNFATDRMPDHNVVLHAKWEINKHNVFYDENGGSYVPDQYNVPYNSLLKKPITPKKVGYTFKGWYRQEYPFVGQWIFPIHKMPDHNVVLHAKWEINKHTVFYDENGGSYVPDQYNVVWNTLVTKPADPTKTGYTFKGWYRFENPFVGQWIFPIHRMPDHNVILHAKWEINQYTLTFLDGYGGTISSADVDYDSLIAYPADPVRTGYTFTGWDSTATNMPANDLTITATWTPNAYTVTYNSNTGDSGTTADSSHTYDVASNLTVNGYGKEGHIFAGWATAADGLVAYTDGQSVINLSAVPGDTVELFAVWTPNTYTVTYNSNTGDSGTTADSSHTYDVASNLTVNGYGKEGHTFAGWATAADGLVAYTDGQSVINLSAVPGDTVELFAVWTINTFTVSFFEEGGAPQIGLTQTIDWDTAAIAETAPAILGSTFAGWALTGDNDLEVDSLTNVKENIIAVATYTPIVYTVTFVDFNGDTIGTDSVLYGEAATPPDEEDITEKPNATFTGWDVTFDFITSSITVTALYDDDEYILTVSIRGEGSTDDISGPHAPGTLIDLTAVGVTPGDGFEFSHWEDLDGNTIDDVTINADTEVVAVFIETAVIVPEDVPEAGDPIEEEPVPEAGPNNDWLWWLLMLIPLGLLLWLIFALWFAVVPIAEVITNNGDGTFTVQWGYENRKISKQEVEEEDSVLTALLGKILSSTIKPPVEFEKGRVENVFSTVAEKDSKIQWKIRNRKAKVDLTKQENK